LAAIKVFSIEQKTPAGTRIFWNTRSTYKEAKELVENHLIKQYPKDIFKIKVFRNLYGIVKLLPADIYYNEEK